MFKFYFYVFFLFSFNKAQTTINDGLDEIYADNLSKEQAREAIGQLTKKFMNLSVDPCQDFYEYACGNWGKMSIPAGIPYTDQRAIVYVAKRAFGNLNNLIKGDMSQFTSGPLYQFDGVFQPRNQILTPAEENVRKFYQSCINVDAIKRRDSNLVKNYLSTWTGWPLEKNSWEPFDWKDFIIKTSKIQINPLFMLTVDSMGTAKNYIMLLPKSVDIKKSISKDSGHTQCEVIDEDSVKKILSDVGLSEHEINSAYEDIIEFQEELDKIEIENPLEGEQKNGLSIEMLNEALPTVDWLDFFNRALDQRLTPKTLIMFDAPSFTVEVLTLLTKTPELKLKRYLFFRLAEALIKLTPTIERLSDPDIRQTFCIEQTKKLLKYPAAALFMRKYFSKAAEDDIRQMSHGIFDEFVETIQTSYWMDESSRQAFAEKVRASKVEIGVLGKEDFIKEAIIDFGQVEMHPDKYFENVLEASKYTNRHLAAKADTPVQISDPMDFNCFYSGQINSSLIIQASFMQPPVYHPDYPGYARFGRMGSILGHELGHAFDVDNFFYNKNSKLESRHGFSTFVNYFVHALCLSRQYGSYGPVEDLGARIDGPNTVAENVADNMGASVALKVYKKWLQDHPEELHNEQIPGLNLTPTQLYFIGYAQDWCATMDLENLKNAIATDVHTPDKFRIIGLVTNSEAFHQEFNCRPGTPMNPIKKCSYE